MLPHMQVNLTNHGMHWFAAEVLQLVISSNTIESIFNLYPKNYSFLTKISMKKCGFTRDQIYPFVFIAAQWRPKFVNK